MRLFALLLMTGPALADHPVVEDATARQTGTTWTISVTLSHPDTGWDHYADGWEVLAPNGTRLGFRELLHPHVNEQPFTRSLSGVTIPDGLTEVLIRPRCNVDDWSVQSYAITLP
ncbi:MAG: hypothetical protein QNJ44_21655 [Rhodobacter sp.]|nr:hypothetical protein [Rhodobacter sp.]